MHVWFSKDSRVHRMQPPMFFLAFNLMGWDGTPIFFELMGITWYITPGPTYANVVQFRRIFAWPPSWILWSFTGLDRLENPFQSWHISWSSCKASAQAPYFPKASRDIMWAGTHMTHGDPWLLKVQGFQKLDDWAMLMWPVYIYQPLTTKKR